MHKIESQDELVARIKAIKKRSRRKKPFTLRAVATMNNSNGRVRHGWTYMHELINYRGDDINVKVPAFTSSAMLNWRETVERQYNQSFALAVSPEEGLKIEAEAYQRLRDKNFPTLHPVQHLIEDENDLLVEGVLLTEQLHGSENLQDLVRINPSEGISYACAIARKLKELHTHGEIWVDALLQNTMRHKRKVLVFDFNLLPNTATLPIEQLQALDLTDICLSAAGRLGRDYGNVVKPMIAAYDPPEKVAMAMQKRLQSDIERNPGKIATGIEEFTYLRPKYLLEKGQERQVKRTMLHSLG
jgi:hypothetical protein